MPFTLWIMPICWGLPNASPFVLKLQTWLRMAEIPYETHELGAPPKSSTGKLPYIELEDGTLIADSSQIVAWCRDNYAVSLDRDLTAAERAQSTMLQRLVEDHLYWALVHGRWHADAGWAITKRGYFGFLPPVLRDILPLFLRRKVRSALHGQGFGRMPPQWVDARGCEDIDALSEFLGDKEFFLGRMTSIDATVFGFVGNLLYAPVPCAIKTRIEESPNLVTFCGRVRERYFPEMRSSVQIDDGNVT